MFVICVSIWIKPGHEQDFIRAIELNHRGTRKESGNLRFDVLQAVDDPARFFLYEVYRDEQAFATHQQTEHYHTWRRTVADWMAQPRQGLKYRSLFPGDEAF
jgi:(4S)-4-hydroxy-5-phosphonooxypentane-2,3-dione isomerase